MYKIFAALELTLVTIMLLIGYAIITIIDHAKLWLLPFLVVFTIGIAVTRDVRLLLVNSDRLARGVDVQGFAPMERNLP